MEVLGKKFYRPLAVKWEDVLLSNAVENKHPPRKLQDNWLKQLTAILLAKLSPVLPPPGFVANAGIPLESVFAIAVLTDRPPLPRQEQLVTIEKERLPTAPPHALQVLNPPSPNLLNRVAAACKLSNLPVPLKSLSS